MKILLAADSFKGSLSSSEANETLERAARGVFPDCVCHRLTIADGGEGTLSAFEENPSFKGYEKVMTIVSDPLGRPVFAYYLKRGLHAIIEMAQASGLTLLRADERDPRITTSRGTGELIAHALKNGCREIYIAIGGSATNDGGTGAMTALGFGFLDKEGTFLNGTGKNLKRIARIDDSNVLSELKEATFTVMCDVNNPLTGPSGATYVYGPQKGATEEALSELESGMVNFLGVLQKFNDASEGFHTDISAVPGLGAAGGMGASLKVLLKAGLKSGIDVLLDLAGFEDIAGDADMLITGEGKTDSQSARGKVISGLLKRSKKMNIPLYVISGRVDPDADILYEMGVAGMVQASPQDASLDDAMAHAKENLYIAASELFNNLKG